MSAPFAGRLLMIGAGAMGGAMLGRWLDAGLDPGAVTVVSPSGRSLPDGVTVLRTVPAPTETPFDLILLALKPQQLATLAATPLAAHRPRMLVSILAGVDQATLADASGAAATVRAMPNLPVAIGRGVVALHASGGSDDDRATLDALMAPLGLVEWIAEEALFDAVTALSGCGPAFVFRFVDALAQAGGALGLPADQAARLALATVAGAAAQAVGADATPAVLADRVASPGGSTREGLNVLDRDDALERLMRATLAAAARRNVELAELARR